MRGRGIHGYRALEISGSLVHGEFAERQLHVHFHAKCAQTHEVPDDLASAGTVVEQSGMQHHFFRIKTDAFVGAGIMVVAAYWIGIHPGEHELKVMPGHPFVDD